MFDPYADFSTGHLANGVPVYNYHRPGCEFIHLDIIIHAGANDDGPDEVGLSHFVEHMVCANSGFSLSETERFFEEVGGEFHASTYFPGTRFGFKLPLADHRLDEGIEYLVQAMFQRGLNDHFDREMEVIRSEIERKYPTPKHVTMVTEVKSTYFRGTPLAWAPSPAGRLETLHNITMEKVQTFHNKHYTTTNATVVCVGGLSLSEVLNLLNQSLGQLRKSGERNKPLPTISAIEPLVDNRLEYRLVEGPAQGRVDVQQLILFPASVPYELTRIGSEVLSNLILDEVRDKRGLAYSTGANGEDHSRFSGLATFAQSVAETRAKEVEEVLWWCIDNLHKQASEFEKRRVAALKTFSMLDLKLSQIHGAACEDLLSLQRIIPLQEEYQKLVGLKLPDWEEFLELFKPEDIITVVCHK